MARALWRQYLQTHVVLIRRALHSVLSVYNLLFLTKYPPLRAHGALTMPEWKQ